MRSFASSAKRLRTSVGGVDFDQFAGFGVLDGEHADVRQRFRGGRRYATPRDRGGGWSGGSRGAGGQRSRRAPRGLEVRDEKHDRAAAHHVVKEVERNDDIRSAPRLEGGFRGRAEHVPAAFARRHVVLDSSVKRTRPTLSLLRIAEKARTLANSAASSRLLCAPEPKSPDALTSTEQERQLALLDEFFNEGRPARAVTFQSMVRTSSPGEYSRTSSKSMPRPLKTQWYSPASVSFTSVGADLDLAHLFQDFAVCSGSIASFFLLSSPPIQGTGSVPEFWMMSSEVMFSASAS